MASVTHTDCCIVGGGPAGMFLAYILVRYGVRVTVLEAHADFDRDFRGDTMHPSVLELLDTLNLADDVLALAHGFIHELVLETEDGSVTVANFRRLPTRFPFVALVPQAKFLTYLAERSGAYPGFDLRLGARAEELVRRGGTVSGVRYNIRGEWHEVSAALTIAADGRFSRMRKVVGLQPITTSPPMDVLWFRLPAEPGDSATAAARTGRGGMMVFFRRDSIWQVGYIIPKGSYCKLHAAGIEAFRDEVVSIAPEFKERVAALQDWKQVMPLSVASNRLPRWFLPGLLFIGDAAHTMSPVGGVGINYAIQDAAAAANLLLLPLLAGAVWETDLVRVQRTREWPTRLIQAIQALLQRAVIQRALEIREPFRIPLWVRLLIRLPLIRDIPARLVGFGVGRVRLRLPR